MNSAAQAFIEARDLLLAHREDYQTAVARFRWPRLSQFNWALDYFDAMALGNGAPALCIVEESGEELCLSFDALRRSSNAVANHLRALGVRRGERVLVMMGNQRELWEAMLACIKLGAVVVPATTLLSPDDLLDRFERGGVRHVIVQPTQAHKFDALPAQLLEGCTRVATGAAPAGWQPFDAAYAASEVFIPDGPTQASDALLLYFTSGTTAKPKLVLHTHQSYPVGHLSTMYWLGLRPGDMHLNISSPGWAKHAWSCLFAPWNAQACVFIFNQARFSARALLDTLARHPVSSLCAPPTVWRMLIQEDLAAWAPRLRLRELIGAGEPLNPEVIAQVQAAWGLTIRDGFGQTETTAQVGNTPGQPLVAGSMGRPLPGYQIALLDAEGRPADEGELAICLEPRPLGLMPGYEGDAERSAEVMRAGHYRTGDVARRDAQGFITYVGRADDVFKSSDYRISPFELESVLIEHAAVAEAAVVPSPDALRLAVPKAFIMLREGRAPDAATAADIYAFLRTRLAPFKRIRKIEFCDLPKTISGKIRRVQLRELERQRSDQQQGVCPAHEFPEP
ncbi:AMP-binding protein [Paucibacter soli]|uniref:AMP-binding protein n=1 Tax=Paucibacter soli TaxID=3133433 RepID=UPI00309F114A